MPLNSTNHVPERKNQPTVVEVHPRLREDLREVPGGEPQAGALEYLHSIDPQALLAVGLWNTTNHRVVEDLLLDAIDMTARAPDGAGR